MKTKHLLFFAAFMLAFLTGFSQPTLTFANVGIQPGDNVTMYNADTTGVALGSAGASQVWNYASLVIGTSPSTTSYVDPATTAYASSFPTATVASSGTTNSYMKINTMEYTFLGVVSSSVSMVYSDPETMNTFPFSYTDSYTDNFAATFVSGVTFDRTGTIATDADGWGTLLLPSGSYSTLRVKMVQDITDASTYGDMVYHSESYIWYDGINPTPLLEIVISTTDMMGTITHSKSVMVGEGAAGICDCSYNLPVFDIFPNPASDAITFSIDSKETTMAEISILDVQGKEVKQIKYDLTETGINQLTLDVADLADGIYFVRVSNSKGLLYKKLVKN
jgi:hypothetical protein